MQVILTHENADFDAIASLLGASKLFPAATPVLPRRINRNGRTFLALYGAELPFVEPDDLPREEITRAVLVDTQGLTSLKGMVSDLQVDIIDHHELDRELPDNWTYSGETIGATTTMLTEEISARFLTLTDLEATLLLLGIYEDTGSLSYKGTTVRDIRAAAWLVEQGARLEVANEFLHYPLVSEQRDLYEQLLEQSETYEIEGHTIIVACAEAPDYTAEIATLAHKLRDLLEPSALFVLVDLDGRVQLVARSATDDIDVSRMAKHFGGGGHSRAAAALIRHRELQTVRDDLLEQLPDVVQPAITVAQVMSLGVQKLTPADTVADADYQMRRTGHEGYPVVQNGQVIGLLTRRAVDRALQFEMTEAPVTQVMDAGHVTISPDDSIEYLRQLMIESGWGQVPVVDDGEIIGVVTRTDLITLWGMPPQASQRLKVATRLEQALSDPVLALVRRISRTAHEMDVVPYFVGGLVRDLLLGQSIVDVDMVIEGDAIALAERLADDLGGRVTTHKQFGTAKWILSRDVWRRIVDRIPSKAELPPSVDFVTARTEFYTHPSALPQVERSSIKQDLHRRDFTINTLAIHLDPDRWGELLDFYGGEADLEEGIIRVLHSLSFVDDPTRMLRAARLESRLGFRIEPRTRELIDDALPLLKRVSGARIYHELELIFQEDEPERALGRMDELGVLAQIHQDLRCDQWLRERYRALRQELNPDIWTLETEDNAFLHLALLAYRLDEEALQELSKRLKVKRDAENDLLLMHKLRSELSQLADAQRPSDIFRQLQPYPARVLAAVWLATDREPLRERLLRYQTEWRQVEPEITGDDLKAMGLEPGPLFGELLSALRDARLDGEVSTREEEEALVNRLVTREQDDERTGGQG